MSNQRDIERLEYSIMESNQIRESYLRLVEGMDELIKYKEKKLKELVDKS